MKIPKNHLNDFKSRDRKVERKPKVSGIMPPPWKHQPIEKSCPKCSYKMVKNRNYWSCPNCGFKEDLEKSFIESLFR